MNQPRGKGTRISEPKNHCTTKAVSTPVKSAAHSRTPSQGINVYSFALKPEEHQPSGTCNFSRIDKATLQLTVSVNTVRSGRTAQVRVYAVNYNVLRVMSGMGGLAYSN